MLDDTRVAGVLPTCEHLALVSVKWRWCESPLSDWRRSRDERSGMFEGCRNATRVAVREYLLGVDCRQLSNIEVVLPDRPKLFRGLRRIHVAFSIWRPSP